MDLKARMRNFEEEDRLSGERAAWIVSELVDQYAFGLKQTPGDIFVQRIREMGQLYGRYADPLDDMESTDLLEAIEAWRQGLLRAAFPGAK